MSTVRRRHRYGHNGRSHTSPALVARDISWMRPDPAAMTARLMSSAARPPALPDRPRRLSTTKDSNDATSLVSKYVLDSKERSRPRNDSIDDLMKRYRPSPEGSSGRIADIVESRRPSTDARLSGSDVRVKWDVATTSTAESPSRRASLVATGRMPVGGSSSRSGRLARISQSNIRPFGSGAIAAANSAHGPGGAPLNGPEPGSPQKKEFKHRFEIVKKLGSGTYGKVSLAFDHKFEREVAVKLIKKSAIENKADLVRIRREIRIMSALNHPNIIQIFEVFENKEKIILVMEYANGGELYDYVSKYGSLPEAEARRIFRQITSAVLYCHKHKVAHRDLKLENILLDQDNNAKIADFGLSNYFSDKSLLTTFCGSPLYASPEIINGTPYKGPEVDCWSLGILLYTLVYGSMPFDGRDFNRMVRQIKRGAYYEPDQPSTASMLIRNMLRVNPDRRADIFDIASHWWLNLEENMPVIQELPENQVTDTTPLTERAETMIVQDLADETDVFMEFGHLSSETRKKIEEFRRRRKEAEEYIDHSPVKPPKTRKTEGEEMSTEEKSLRGGIAPTATAADDPLERLRQIESRLAQPLRLSNLPSVAPSDKEIPRKQIEKPIVNGQDKKTVIDQPEDPKTARNPASTRAPSFVPVHEPSPPPSRRGSIALRGSTLRIETDSLNMLMNQVLEQMEKGPVSLNLVARIKAHPLYDSRPMVKELLESIIGAQPDSIQQQTSKLVEQQSQSTLRKKKPEEKTTKTDRRQVGFDPDDEMKDDSMRTSTISTATEVTVQDTSFEDSDDQKEATPQPTAETRQTQTDRAMEEEEEDDEEYSDSEMEELADVVDKVEDRPKIEVKPVEALEAPPPPDPAISPSPQYLDAFDRGLIKRQSKGKYQHSHVDMYGRGVSTECESPTLTRKTLGGPQPFLEHAPFLFDKAKKIIMEYPGKPDPAELEDVLRRKKKNWLKNIADQDKPKPAVTNCVGSVPPRTPPPIHSDNESEGEDEDEEEEEEEEEESDVEITRGPPRRVIVGTVRRDGDPILTTVTEIGGTRKTSYMQSAPASVHASMSPEPKPLSIASTHPTSAAKYFVTVAELKAKPTEPKPYSGIGLGGSNVANTKENIEKKIAEKEAQITVTAETKPADSPSKEEREPSQPAPGETAAAFIRRKNRERRFRNRTIGAPEEIMRSTPSGDNRPHEDGLSDIHHHIPGTDPFYSHHTGGSSLLGYVRPRIHEDSYRQRDFEERPLSPSRFHQSALRDDRGRSFVHDMSPDRPDYRSSAYAVTDTRSYYGSNASPSYSRKFDDSYNLQSWATEPRRFEVYKTRAERDREMHTMHTTPTAPSSYHRPSSYYSDRPLNAYAYQPRQEPYRADTTSSYRRTFDLDRSVTPGSEIPSVLSTLPPSSDVSSTRATARRVQSALTENDRRAYNRSRSMDRKQGRPDDYSTQLRTRLMTPETTDYSYVNYHDSSNGRSSITKDDKGQPRSILKNKQTAENEPRATDSSGTSGPVKSVIDRLRRHLSLEKTPIPPSTTSLTSRAPSVGVSITNDTGFIEDSPKKKRSLLSSFNRRRTSEVRLGNDGKLITNGIDDGYKRPTSPIDKIKSFFRKSDSTTQPHSDLYVPHRYGSSLVGDKPMTSFPSSNVASTRDTYVPQYRKYPGSSTRDPTTAINRYSYTPGLTDQRRHWYDDHNLY